MLHCLQNQLVLQNDRKTASIHLDDIELHERKIFFQAEKKQVTMCAVYNLHCKDTYTSGAKETNAQEAEA